MAKVQFSESMFYRARESRRERIITYLVKPRLDGWTVVAHGHELVTGLSQDAAVALAERLVCGARKLGDRAEVLLQSCEGEPARPVSVREEDRRFSGL
jgi:hypothetical protein